MALPNDARYFADLNEATAEADSHVLALQQGSPPTGGETPTPTRRWSLLRLRTWLFGSATPTNRSVPVFNSTTGRLQGTGVFVDASDNLGVGVSDTLGFKMRASGNMLISGRLSVSTGTSDSIIRATESNDGGDTRILLGNTASSGSSDETVSVTFNHEAGRQGGKIVSGRAGDYVLNNARNSYLAFFTAASNVDSEWMRITSSGRVLVGTLVDNGAHKLQVAGAISFSPGASVAPVGNGSVVFELTNNTTLTVKARGSDGTVRSGTITLS